MLFLAAALAGLALYTGWTRAAWTINGPIRNSDDSLSYWWFILSYLVGALIFALGHFSPGGGGGIAALLVCVVLIELWTGIQFGRVRIIRFSDNPGGFFAETTLWLILALLVAVASLPH